MTSVAFINRRCGGILKKVNNAVAIRSSSVCIDSTCVVLKSYQDWDCTWPQSSTTTTCDRIHTSTSKITSKPMIMIQTNYMRSFSTLSDVNVKMDDETPNPTPVGVDLDLDVEKESTTFKYNSEECQAKIFTANEWNQGKEKWDPQYCQDAVDDYCNHLKYLLDLKLKSTSTIPDDALKTILSSSTTWRALRAMTKMNIDTHILSKKVREVERLIGQIGCTPLTDRLSLALLEANGKAGNIGRTVSLLQLRKKKGYRPCRKEFNCAIQSIISAGLYLRKNRNIFLKDGQQPEIDNPTRWLDAILVNMSERGAKLDTKMANKMLDCYCSTGRTGKANHFFYKVTRDYIDVNGNGKNLTSSEEGEIRPGTGTGTGTGTGISDEIMEQMPVFEDRKTKVRMRMNWHMPPYYKVPSDVKMNGEMVKRPGKDDLIKRIEWEKVRV